MKKPNLESGALNEIIVPAGENKVILLDSNCSVAIKVGVGAKVKVVLLQSTDSSVITASVERDAKIEWFLNYFGGGSGFVQSHLIGENAVSDMNICFYVRDAMRLDLFAGNCFDARNCKGVIMVKGVSADQAKASFLGEIDITLQGGGTDSFLREEVLMMDATSKIDAIPSLEIKTNDVKAGHGVSISRLTDDKLFYLTSRGISTDEARKLVLSGFLKDLYSKCDDEGITEKLDGYLV